MNTTVVLPYEEPEAKTLGELAERAVRNAQIDVDSAVISLEGAKERLRMVRDAGIADKKLS